MICAFLGEHKSPFKHLGKLERFITSLAMNSDIHEFYVGNHTDFEIIILCILRGLKKLHNTIQYTVVLTPADINCAVKNESVIWLEPNLPKGTKTKGYSKDEKEIIIDRRDDWLAENADLIVYSDYLEDDKEDWIEAYAKEHKKEYMNLAFDEYFM